MQQLQQNLINDLLNRSEFVLNCAATGDLQKARQGLDEIRILSHIFTRAEANAPDLSTKEGETRQDSHSLAALAKSFESLAQWLNSVRASWGADEMLLSATGVDVYLDCYLPLTWNWEEDLVILDDSLPPEVEEALTARGQKFIVVLRAGFSSESIKYIDSVSSAYDALRGWSNYYIGRSVVLSTDALSERSSILFDEISQIFRDFRIGQNTISRFSHTWALQQIRNLNWVVASQPVEALNPIFEGRSCFVVSPGPSLAKNIAKLERKSDDQIILAVAQACPALAKHGIKVDYVLVIDPLDYSHVLEDFDCRDVKGLIIGDACHSAFFAKNFRQLYTFCSVRPSFGIDAIVGSSSTPLHGGSVSVVAATLAVACGVRYLTLVGSDLAISEGAYYGYQRSENGPVSKHEISVPGYYGGQVKTKPDYASFIQEFQRLANTAGVHSTLINATEGGALVEGFINMPLEEALELVAPPRSAPFENILSTNEIQTRAKRLSAALIEERALIAKANLLAADCAKLARKLKSPESPKVKRLRKKETQLAQLTDRSTTLQIYCRSEMASILRQLKVALSFEDNIALSLRLYASVTEATTKVRGELSNQIKALALLN